MVDSKPTPTATGGAFVEISTRNLARAVLIGALLLELFFVWGDYAINYGQATTIGPVRRLFNIAQKDSLAS